MTPTLSTTIATLRACTSPEQVYHVCRNHEVRGKPDARGCPIVAMLVKAGAESAVVRADGRADIVAGAVGAWQTVDLGEPVAEFGRRFDGGKAYRDLMEDVR